MYENGIEPDEITQVVRKHNRILRRIVSNLRQNVQKRGEQSDKLFMALCETNPAAELAMRELWEKGGFQSDCSPENYDYIVDVCLRALKAYSGTAFQPTHRLDAAQCALPSKMGAYGWTCTRENGHGGPCAMVYDH